MLYCLSAFVSGMLLVLLVEALLILFIVSRLVEKKNPRPLVGQSSSVSVEVADESFVFKLQGGVWIAALPAGDVKKMYTKREKALREKAAKEQQKNEPDKGGSKRDPLRGYTEVSPVWRSAKLQGRILHLTCQGVTEHILLEGCEIQAVSGSLLPGRKWTKKLPLRVHNASRDVYKGCHDCLLYLETGWEKEAWCEVLRGAANEDDSVGNRWYHNVKKEYKDYCDRVENQFPSSNEVGQVSLPRGLEEKSKIPKPSKAEVTANTKKRLLWKKLTRRSIKVRDGKSTGKEDTKKGSGDDPDEGSSKGASISSLASEFARTASIDDLSLRDLSGDEKALASRLLNPETAGEQDSQGFVQSENLERSLFCVNTLFARLFFDLYHSPYVVDRIQAKLQRQLAKVTAPSYIGKINCSHLDLGKSPPLARNIQFLAMESDGSWGIEADLEYYGGAILTIETRIDVRDSNAREKGVVQGIEQTLAGAPSTDLLTRSLENMKDDFHIGADDQGSAADQRNPGVTSTSTRPVEVKSSEEGSRKGWINSGLTTVKTAMSRFAEQVSQVPLALTIRVVQFKGKLQVRIKPPPSDRIWFSFRDMPTLELMPEPCIGDHKINSGPLGALVVNQIKNLIHDTLVFPQCEDTSYTWMMADAENWLPREVVPLPFVADQVQSDQSNGKERRETQMKRESSVDNFRVDASAVGPSQSFPGIPSEYNREDFGSRPTSPVRVNFESCVSLPAHFVSVEPYGELSRPLLGEGEKEEPDCKEYNGKSESVIVSVEESPPQLVTQSQTQALSSSDSDTGSLKSEEMGLVQKQRAVPSVKDSKRTKVFTFGKKVGSRLDEKRRSVLEKMRDRSQQGPDRPPG